jgi:hypothetical protein
MIIDLIDWNYAPKGPSNKGLISIIYLGQCEISLVERYGMGLTDINDILSCHALQAVFTS